MYATLRTTFPFVFEDWIDVFVLFLRLYAVSLGAVKTFAEQISSYAIKWRQQLHCLFWSQYQIYGHQPCEKIIMDNCNNCPICSKVISDHSR